MTRKLLAAAAAFLLGHAPALAQADTAKEPAPTQAAGIRLSYSIDADDTEVVASGVVLDVQYRDAERYRGVEVEHVAYNPLGLGWRNRDRVFLRGADRQGDLRWTARVGTDGHTVLGSASLRTDTRFAKEVFVERDIVETPTGLARGIYYTFAGAAIDLPLDGRNVFNLLAGVQEYTGDNVRLHLRANYIHVLDEDRGLSLQLRGRYFRNSDPREFDYYSPRWYAQALPVLQLRRFSHGWQYLVAGGVGLQRDNASDWRRSSYFNARVTSPPAGDWYFQAGLLFSETPTTAGQGYRYVQGTIGLSRRF